MSHILYAHVFLALEGALGRDPTEEELSRAIKAIKKYNPSAFEIPPIPKINISPKEKKPLSLWGRIIAWARK